MAIPGAMPTGSDDISPLPKCLSKTAKLLHEDWTNAPKTTDLHQNIHAYIANRANEYFEGYACDAALQEQIQEDFTDVLWDKLQEVDKVSAKEFRDILLSRGISVPRHRPNESTTVTLSRRIKEIVNGAEWTIWSPQEHADNIGRIQVNDKSLMHPNRTAERHLWRRLRNNENVDDATANDNQNQVAPTPQHQGQRALSDLMKVYSNNDNIKYGGGRYDFFDRKHAIWRDNIDKVQLPTDTELKAFSLMLKDDALDFYYQHLRSSAKSITEAIDLTRKHFETIQSAHNYETEWKSITLQKVIANNPQKPIVDNYEVMIEKLRKIRYGLPPYLMSDATFRDKILEACQSTPECERALFEAPGDLQKVIARIRNAINVATEINTARQFHTATSTPVPAPPQKQRPTYLVEEDDHDLDEEEYDAFYTDRKYRRSTLSSRGRRGTTQRRGGYRDQLPLRSRDPPKPPQRCWICGKAGCWSWQHDENERQQGYTRYKRTVPPANDQQTRRSYRAFLTEFEGNDDGREEDYEKDSSRQGSQENPDDGYYMESEVFLTDYGQTDGATLITHLDDRKVIHAVTKDHPFNPSTSAPSVHSLPPPILNEQQLNAPSPTLLVFLYHTTTETTFRGILPDTGASGCSSAGEPQVKALQRIQPHAFLDKSTAGRHRIRFGKGDCESLGTIHVTTPIGTIPFEILPTDTPFLMCLQDMDRLKVTYDNIRDVMVKHEDDGTITTYPTVRQGGHPWIMVDRDMAIACNLTEGELRQLHRRFGHPSVQKLTDILKGAGEDFHPEAIKAINKFCHQCQIHAKGPGRFRFNLKDDKIDFNAEVIVDIVYIAGHQVLHVVDSATSFQAARILKSMTTRELWEALRMCWIDVYQGPPERIVHDAGKNFTSLEFKANASAMNIAIKEVPIEAHNSIGKVERYHAPLRRAYEIIAADMPASTPDAVLQSAVKAVNDTAGPRGLVPTLLVFGAYPRMVSTTPTTPDIHARSIAITKAMKELRQIQTRRQIQDALNTRNGPDVTKTLSLAPGEEVLVHRETGGWQGPYKLISITESTATLDMPHGPTKFQITRVKPYWRDHKDSGDNQGDGTQSSVDPGKETPSLTEETPRLPEKRGRGRPKGSRNKPKGLPPSVLLEPAEPDETLLSTKEEHDAILANELRLQGKITTPGKPFQQSDQDEIDALIGNGTFEFTAFDSTIHTDRIFNSRLVREIKGKTTDRPYEKSRLVIQGFNDEGKANILTQSPTIQRSSQRIILALAPSLLPHVKIYLRDITQAYVQSQSQLNRTILASLPKEIEHLYPRGTIMKVIKPLYGIAESGNHWYTTYSRHHKTKLGMASSPYDPCLMISDGTHGFGVVGMQTDDTIILSDDQFSRKEDEELVFKSKPKATLARDHPIDFNGVTIQLADASITASPKGQTARMRTVKTTKEYVEQRARGAYVATICQPEATFDLSIAAQTKDPSENHVKALNKRIQWQIDNESRGLTNVKLNLETAKIYIFVDASFANNQDLSSQIGYVIAIGNESKLLNTQTKITANILHWSSTKCKRVTKSVLASEIYAMTAGADIGYSIARTINDIIRRLNYDEIPIVVCTDSLSLYECIVKLGTTKEKRLMIDIMALREMYENRELVEIRWISGKTNPADAMTKATPNKALTDLIDSNSIILEIQGWVDRSQQTTNEPHWLCGYSE